MFFAMAISFGYPSRLFHHWRRSLRQGRAPLVSTQQQFWVIWIARGNLLLLALLPCSPSWPAADPALARQQMADDKRPSRRYRNGGARVPPRLFLRDDSVCVQT